MRYVTGIFALLVILGMPVLADTQSSELTAEMTAANEEFEGWLAETTAFIDGATFNEEDVRTFVELWPEFEAIEEDSEEDAPIDYRGVLDDPRYKEFVDTHGLDGETWFRKSMRIMMLVMKEQVVVQLAEAEAQLPEQLRMIEENKDQFGEEDYLSMKEAMEASAEMMASQRKAWERIPEPSAAEREALDAHRDDLVMLMMSDDEDEDWDEEDWDE